MSAKWHLQILHCLTIYINMQFVLPEGYDTFFN